VLAAPIPVGGNRSVTAHSVSGATILLDIARRLETWSPRHRVRLVFFEADRDDPESVRRAARKAKAERVAALLAVENLGRRAPLVAIPFTAPGRTASRASTLGLFGHLRGAATPGEFEVFAGDAGREGIFLVASRMFGTDVRIGRPPLREEGIPPSS